MEKYDVINVVGEGSYGIVMKCRHRETGQYVAIKKFLETEDDPTVRKMAIREIRMLKKLRHENLVNMLEVFRRKKRFFLVFEYLEHTVLEELESKVGGLGFITSRKYVYQILRAIDFIHSHNVIHRDIKPENVLVSRLGIIKVCDFGFARPFTENETFTDYVATRWYRSPELLVGDPRYGKEVDIWAIGCLYAEMMTGEPLFPGESDIDQLFQIIRILGKLNKRHQLLITQNSMFNGMKQEQNTTLYELFPDWNINCLDFLQQCLKMDGTERSNTETLLKHNLFTSDNFLQTFSLELRSKLNQETQINPLLKKFNFNGNIIGSGSGNMNNKNNEEIVKVTTVTTNTIVPTTSLVTSTATAAATTAATTNVATTVTTSKSSESIGKINMNSKERLLKNSFLSTLNAHRPSYGTEEQLAPFRHYLTNAATLAAQSKQQQQQQQPIKQISINNLVFQENKNTTNKLSRVSSAKLQKINQQQQQQQSTAIATQLEPPSSPVPFQSLQPDINNLSVLNQNDLTMQGKRLSPANNNQTMSNNALSISGQYFNQKRNSNILGLSSTNQNQKLNKNILQNSSQIPLKSNFIKTNRSNLLDNNRLISNITITNNNTTEFLPKDISPRILPPPQTWLINNNSNNKLNIPSSLLQATTILSSLNMNSMKTNAASNNNKKNLTDWKTIARDHQHQSDFLLPNCPGISIQSSLTSPYNNNSNNKGNNNKKKLSPMSTLITLQDKIFEISATANTKIKNQIITPRNFSASSDQENET